MTIRGVSLSRTCVGALIALHAVASPAQDLSRACPKAHQVTQEHLIGSWRAEFTDLPVATLHLWQHPELAGSVRGQANRGGKLADLAGDVDEGEFTLEESLNGVNISATWLGDVIEGSCGREIRGSWRTEGHADEHEFVLRKQ